MSTVSVRLPDSLYQQVKDVVRKEGVSIDQFISSATAEKISVFATQDYLQERARRANKKKFEEALSHIPDVEPEEYDKL